MKKNTFLLFTFLVLATTYAQKNKVNLLVGTYTNSCDSKGIYVYEFNTKTADFRHKTATNSLSPSFLALSENQKQVYAVNENGAESTVSAFGFDAKTANLNFINKQDSKGADPCHIITDAKNVLVANYSGGTITVFSKNKNGSIAESKQVIQHTGKSINTKRQASAHVHQVVFSPDNKQVLAVDLGTDAVYVYNYNSNATKEILTLKDSVGVKKGSGPRHLIFSKNGNFVYLLQELDGALTAFGYKNGTLTKIQEISVVPTNFAGETSAAEIAISADGNFLYATNRGTANTISVFGIQPNGKLVLKQQTSTLGKGPRNFVIDPSGHFLLVAHQYSNDIVIFKIDKKTGELTNTNKKIDLCSPVCLIFGK